MRKSRTTFLLALLLSSVFIKAADTFDIDGDGSKNALTDGLLVLRYIFGFSGSTLIQGAVSTNASRSTATDIEAYLESNVMYLDIDKDGTNDALTDGLLLLRHLFGFNGQSLVQGALSASAQRTDADAIASYISTTFSVTAIAPAEAFDYSEIEIVLDSQSTITEVELTSTGVEHVGGGMSLVSFHNDIVTARTPIVFKDTEIGYVLHVKDSSRNSSSLDKTLLVKTYEHQIDHSKNLSSLYTGNFTTNDFEVFNFSFDAINTSEKYSQAICYPWPSCSQQNTTEEGYFVSQLVDGNWGDFNGDGHEDFVGTWGVFPHTIERETGPYQTLSNIEIYLNDGQGRLLRTRDMYVGGEPPYGGLLYRTIVDDFNLDGIDDIFAVNQGNTTVVNGDYVHSLSPHVLLLSTPEGLFRDASLDIEGNENTVSGGHASSSGDINGDGYPDLFAYYRFYLNSGGEEFVDVYDQRPEEWKDNWERYTYPMTTLIRDFNGDGFGDVVIFWADSPTSNDPPEPQILVSNGTPTISDWLIVSLPEGHYGAGTTKFNDSCAGDIDGDGDEDIVTSTTRADPYYFGRYIQVLINDGNGNFTDNSYESLGEQPRSGNYDDSSYSHTCFAHGEGSIFLRDYDDDGDLDIVDVSGGGAYGDGCHSVSVFLNSDGSGVFNELDVNLAWLQGGQIDGYDIKAPEDTKMSRAYPINLDNKNNLDFVAEVKAWDESNHVYTYQIISKGNQ